MSGVKQLWLAPICHEDGDGRLWCQNDVWGDDCGCGIEQHSAVRYVLASDYDRDTQALRVERDAMHHEKALALYDLQRCKAERDELRVQFEAMRQGLLAVSIVVDGDIRPTARDCVNGLPYVQDIYGYCDNIDTIIAAALQAKP